jgi:MFS family permease
VFYGWRVVGVCFVAAVFTWGLGVFGASIYLSEVTKSQGWSVSLVSAGITLFYLTNAVSLPALGAVIDRWGPRAVVASGAVLLASGVALVATVTSPWQLHAVFVCMGLGYAAMSVTGLSATIAPWFERHQGRSVAIALTGASFGAMVVVPLLALAIATFGFAVATQAAAAIMAATMLPLSLVVLRFRGPEQVGLARDGDDAPIAAASVGTPDPRQWNRAAAVRTAALWSVAIGFALGLVVQVGFLTHHVKIAEPTLGATGAGWLVGATGLAGLIGRLLLARIADCVALRPYTAGILAAQTAALGLLAVVPGAAVLIAMSLLYGFCLGQITTLSPIVIRREFGAASFGAIYSVAGTVIQFSSAFGPALYGVLRDLFDGYSPVLGIAAGFEFAAMIVILTGRARCRITAA